MRVGDKYIIEIAEVKTHEDDNGNPFSIARIKGFSSLVFDQHGLDRLEKYEDSKLSLLNCHFVVTSHNPQDDGYFTDGKIYKVSNGRFKTNNGIFPIHKSLCSFEELKKYLTAGGGFSAYETSIMLIVEDEDEEE